MPKTQASEDAGFAEIAEEIGTLTELVTKSKTAMETQYKALADQFNGVKGDNDEVKKAAEEATAKYAELSASHQELSGQLGELKKMLDAPIHRSDVDLKDADTKAAIELQKRAFIFKNGNDEGFTPDMANLVDATVYRQVAKKLMQVGIEEKAKVIRSFTDVETKAFDAASMDVAFFSPEMLGLEIDCNIECWSLLDLYGQETVSRSTFMYPKIESYGDIGAYDCDAKCDAELGPEGNIRYLNGKTYDFRGVFCFQRKVLAEANYDLLGFMIRAAQRSHRINRNRALISGDGRNEPLGWLTADCFTKLRTPEKGGATSFNHQDYRRFIASAPVEYGSVVATMHQNIFAYLASALDANGRFIFGDGDMTFSPDAVRDRIRISNCLPDATADNTRGSLEVPFVAGDFLVAAGNWEMAYKSVNRKSMFMEQYVGGSTAWCVKYQFGAEDGGFVGCCPAARTLVVG